MVTTSPLSRRDAVRRMLRQAMGLTVPGLLAGCTRRGTRPIAVGVDSCAHCRMTIDDPRFAAEAVGPKGQVFTFDSVQCLVDFLNAPSADRAALQPFVARFRAPDEFIAAATAQFTESPALRGPMGGAALLAGTSGDVHNGMRVTWAALRAQRRTPSPQSSDTRARAY